MLTSHCCAQGMYLLLVTNKASNILEDLETLRLMSKVLPEYVLPPVDEESIIGAAFELLFAFDEVISLGYKENVTVGQVKQNTEMESHEEKLHKMIIQSKVQDTKVRKYCTLMQAFCSGHAHSEQSVRDHLVCSDHLLAESTVPCQKRSHPPCVQAPRGQLMQFPPGSVHPTIRLEARPMLYMRHATLLCRT